MGWSTLACKSLLWIISLLRNCFGGGVIYSFEILDMLIYPQMDLDLGYFCFIKYPFWPLDIGYGYISI